jgi:hypothetical protein
MSDDIEVTVKLGPKQQEEMRKGKGRWAHEEAALWHQVREAFLQQHPPEPTALGYYSFRRREDGQREVLWLYEEGWCKVGMSGVEDWSRVCPKYTDPVGPLNLDQPDEESVKVCLAASGIEALKEGRGTYAWTAPAYDSLRNPVPARLSWRKSDG